jgi:hypothetical protein
VVWCGVLCLCSGQLPGSAARAPILGLSLLHLLVENRLAEFHSEVSQRADNDRQRPVGPRMSDRGIAGGTLFPPCSACVPR